MERSFAYIRSISKRIIISYIADWLILIVFIAGGAAFSLVPPTKAAFSVFDASIAYPFVKDTISITTVGLVAVVAPAILIAIICVLTVPKSTSSQDESPRFLQTWGHKLWEIFVSWTGLVLSFALALFIVQATKNLFGKQRPDFLSRCQPDFNKIHENAAGRFGEFDFDDVLLVTAEICRAKNGSGVGLDEFDDGFRAFPSGHTTISFAGLIYLALFLAAKFAVVIPYLRQEPNTTQISSEDALSHKSGNHLYKTAAAPPLHLLVLVLIPVGGAVYISGTRYSDHKHDGFTILFSAILGTVIAWFAFRWYHAPVRRGAGWAWGPRSRQRAFGIGMGVGSYSGPESWRQNHRQQSTATVVDLERGTSGPPRRAPMQTSNEDPEYELNEYRPSPVIPSDSSQRRLRSESFGVRN